MWKCWSKDEFFIYDSDKNDIRLPFCRSFSTFWNLFGSLYTEVLYSWAWVRSDAQSSVHNPNIKQETFQI